MVKNRKLNVQIKHGNIIETSAAGSSSRRNQSRSYKLLSTTVGVICLLTAVYVGLLGYLETRVNTPFDGEKVIQQTGLDVPERYWGSYRPGVYFGMKTREPRSPVFGLMWYDLTGADHKGIRHWCDQNDKLPSYGWIRHDGVSFGEQTISDPPYHITTSFVKSPGAFGGYWTARINVTSTKKSNAPFVLIWYGALDEASGAGPHSRLWADRGSVAGYTPALGNFRLQLVPHHGKLLHTSVSEAHAPGLHQLKEKLYSLLKMEGRLAVLGADKLLEVKEKQVNFVPIQLVVETPFVLDVVYSGEGLPSALKGDHYTRSLQEMSDNFDRTFEEKFRLAERGYSGADVGVARAALSNMLGGVGYFWGGGRVMSQHTREPVPYWKAALYTAVPSRSFFPRGFLWDEGFHGLLLGRWSPEIQLDIAGHWLDLINVEGWIPREQILGVEALARVPSEFVVQNNAAANPPMLLLQVAHLLTVPGLLDSPRHRNTLDRMFPRLQLWYNWFLSSQRGVEASSFMWRGRVDDGLQLNPKTLTSGLDDYPRASHPDPSERHVDLRCWMHAAAAALADLAAALHRDTDKFTSIRDQLGDEELLNKLHWSSHTNSYADYGLHTDGVTLVRQGGQSPGETTVVRAVTVQPQYRLVTSHFGYVSLFPMLLKVLSPRSEKLGKILQSLDDPDILWSPYGLRSLSKSSPLYLTRNTEHDPPYWRGQVWINVNYLALAALRHYGAAGGPHAARARGLHEALKRNVVGNILQQYKQSGYLWEQYSDQDGTGSGCRPFTGWSALFVLMMADQY